MAAVIPEDTFTLGADVLASTQGSDGTVLAQTGDNNNSTDDTPTSDSEVWGPIGYLARPAAPSPKVAACQTISIPTGSNDVLIAFRDQRANITLNPGEVCVFAPGSDGTGTTRILIQDGTVTVTAGTVILAGPGDNASLDSKIQTELQAIWTEFGTIAKALSDASVSTTGSASAQTGPLICSYSSASKSAPGTTKSAKVQLS